jgi:hypothetical protein
MLKSKKAGISCHSIENGLLGFEGKASHIYILPSGKSILLERGEMINSTKAEQPSPHNAGVVEHWELSP